jgi:hypothetical protein
VRRRRVAVGRCACAPACGRHASAAGKEVCSAAAARRVQGPCCCRQAVARGVCDHRLVGRRRASGVGERRALLPAAAAVSAMARKQGVLQCRVWVREGQCEQTGAAAVCH